MWSQAPPAHSSPENQQQQPPPRLYGSYMDDHSDARNHLYSRESQSLSQPQNSHHQSHHPLSSLINPSSRDEPAKSQFSTSLSLQRHSNQQNLFELPPPLAYTPYGHSATPYHNYPLYSDSRPTWSAPLPPPQGHSLAPIRLPPPSELLSSHPPPTPADYSTNLSTHYDSRLPPSQPPHSQRQDERIPTYFGGRGSISSGGDESQYEREQQSNQSHHQQGGNGSNGNSLRQDDMIEISTSRVGGTSSTSGSTSSAGTRTGNTSNTTASSRSVTVAKPKQAVAPVAIGKGGEPVKPRKRRRKLTEEPRDQAMRRFKCDTCGKAFARPSALKTHDRSHSKIRPHVCPFTACQRAFAVSCNLRRHQRVYKHFMDLDDLNAAAAEAASMEEDGQPHDEERDEEGDEKEELEMMDERERYEERERQQSGQEQHA